MAKTSVADWSETASENTDIAGYDIAEGAYARNWNDALRNLMAQSATKFTSIDTSISGALLASSNLSDLDNASTARTNLGVAIGSDVQAYDAGLASIAGLTITGDKILYTTGSDTYALTGLTAFARSILDDADEATFKATVNLEIGTDVQAQGDVLDDLNTLGAATADGQFLVATGAGAFAWESDSTARASLGLGTMATGAADDYATVADLVVTVKTYGAVGDEVTDDTTAFQDAVNAAPEIDYQSQHSAIIRAKIKYVRVPAGNYNITSKVTSDAKVVWIFDDAADVTDAELLTGTISRTGVHVNSVHTGILENATSFAVRAGKTDLDEMRGSYGITTEDTISVVGPPHSVALQLDNDTQVVPIELTGTTYTATTVSYTNSPDLSDVKVGATITAFDTPTMTAIITDVNENTKTITASGGWRPFTGSSGSTGTPTNGVSAHIDYFAKIWAQNTNVFLRSGHPTEKAAGYEMGVLNYQSDAQPLDFTSAVTPIMWGFDAVNLGPYKSSAAFAARTGTSAAWRTGFASYGVEIGFQVFAKSGFTTSYGFSYEVGSGIAFRSVVGGANAVSITATGTMELGRQDVAQTTLIDLHSSGNVNDYDVRIAATGGSASAGTGTLTITAVSLDMNGILRPSSDATHNLGQSTRRFSNVFAANMRPGNGSVIWTTGTGTPEGAVTAPVGSLYTDTSGGAGTTLYVKESGSGNTGWIAK